MTLPHFLRLCRDHLRLIILTPAVLAILTGLYSSVVISDLYTATTSMYVMVDQEAAVGYALSSSTLQSDLNSSQMITTDVSDLLKSDRVRSEAAAKVGLASLRGYSVSTSNEESSRVIYLSVTGHSPDKVAAVANALVTSVSEVAQDVMGIESVTAVDVADAPLVPSGPNRLLYVMAAAIAGLLGVIGALILSDTLSTRVKTDEELESVAGVPVLGHMPEVKDGEYYRA